MHPVDAAVSRVARWLSASDARFPTSRFLELSRRTATQRTLERFRADALALELALESGDANARKELERIAERALQSMRGEALEIASKQGVSKRILAEVHAWWIDTDAEEYLDDPEFDPALRVRVLAHLDAMNEILGSYRVFFDAMRPLFRPSGVTRILDLAAGHGGFALEAARIARAEGLQLELTASDVKDEYLEIGRTVAAEEQLGVDFVLQDALDLSNISRGEYDIITCTQSLHHFRPGLVAVMLAEALRVAGRGVVFVDGFPSLLGAAAVGSLCLLRYADAAFAHDAVVSFRRFFAPEELELMAKLTRRGDRAEVRCLSPGHTLVRATN